MWRRKSSRGKWALSARLDTLLRETFIEYSITEAIQASRYADDFTVNTATIEISLLSLQNYLGFVFPHNRGHRLCSETPRPL